MLIPEDRVAFFDVVVALVRRIVSGDVRTGYFGLEHRKGGGLGADVEGIEEVFSLLVLVDVRMNLMMRKR